MIVKGVSILSMTNGGCGVTTGRPFSSLPLCTRMIKVTRSQESHVAFKAVIRSDDHFAIDAYLASSAGMVAVVAENRF